MAVVCEWLVRNRNNRYCIESVLLTLLNEKVDPTFFSTDLYRQQVFWIS